MKIKKMLKQGAYQPGFVNPVPDNDIGLTLSPERRRINLA
jgi:hypothetical protein